MIAPNHKITDMTIQLYHMRDYSEKNNGVEALWGGGFPDFTNHQGVVRQFLFAVRVGCVVVWTIFSTSKMKAFCIYFYQWNNFFKNITNLVSFIMNLVEYLVINSYFVTVLDNFRERNLWQSKKAYFFGGIQQPHFHSGESPHPPPWSAILDEGLMKVSLWQFELPLLLFLTTSLQVGELCSCMSLSINQVVAE